MRIAWIVIVACTAGWGWGQATRPATRPSPGREALRKEIIQRIMELDAPDPATRDRATQRLIAIGPAALGPIKEVLAGSPPPELEARAKLLLDQIPEKWKFITTEGGEVAAGFQATLRCRGEEFAAGAPIRLSLQIQNAGGIRRQMVSLRGVDVELDGKVFSSKWGDAKVVIQPLAKTPLPGQAKPVVLSRGEPEMAQVDLGGILGDTIQLDQAATLAPGEYEIRVVYYTASHHLIPDAEEDVTSNPIRIRIKP